MKRDKIFISYSHKDKVWFDELQTHLKPYLREQGIILWDDRSIATGDLWRGEIDKALQSACMAILLVSPNFLASDFIANVELPFILSAAQSRDLKVCWLLISQCSIERTDLSKFQAAHDASHSLDSLKKPQRNTVLKEISKNIFNLYQVAKDTPEKPSTKAPSPSSKNHTTGNSSNIDTVVRYISGLLDETTLLSAEKHLLDKAEFFVGRDSEQRTLHRSRVNCVEKNRTETVFIQGDFGTGKTSIISKFLIDFSADQQTPALVVYTQCQEEKEHEGWLPFITLFKILIVKTIKNKIFSKRQLAQYLLEFCFAWLKLAGPDEIGSLFENSNFSQDAIYIQFGKFLRKIGCDHLLVIVIDDLQWADRASLGLLSYLTSETINSPLLILTAFRPEGLEKGFNADELKKTRTKLLLTKHVNEVNLPFGINVEEYIQKRYHANILPEELIRKIEHYSDGQALYLEQFFSHLELKNFIVYEEEGSHWTLTNSMGTPSVPENIKDVLEIRLREMKDDYRQILNMASIEGEEFTVQIVSKLVQREEEDIISQLPRLSAESRLITEEGPLDIDILTFDFYKFTHRFFREYIYYQLGADKRRRLHREVAEHLEDLAPNKSSLASVLANHYLEAHDYGKGTYFAKLAAEQAYKVGKWSEAIEWAKEVLKAINHDKLQRIQETVDVLVIWANSAGYLGQYDDLSDKLDEFIPLVKDKNKLLYARLMKAHAAYCYIENKSGGTKSAKLAIQIFHELNDFQNELDTKRTLADILVDFENDLEEGIKINRELVQESEIYQDFRKVAFNYSSLAWSLLYTGKFREAFNFAQKASDLLSEESNDLYTLGFMHRVIGRAFFKLGQYQEAILHQQQAVAFYQRIGDVLEEHWARFELGASYLEQGMNEDGLNEYHACLQYSQKVEDYQFQAWVRAEYATIKMYEGNFQRAEDELEEVKKLLSIENTREDQLDYLIRLAQLHILKGDYHKVKSLNSVAEAEKLILKHGFEIELIKINYLKSQLCDEDDEFEQAIQYLNQNILLCKKLEAMVELCESYEHLGDLYSRNGAYLLGGTNYQSALSIRNELGHNHKAELILSKLNALPDINQ